jgi:hypothetical protein
MSRILIGVLLSMVLVIPAPAGAGDPTPRCDGGMDLPKVFEKKQLKAAMSKRVVVFGNVERIPMSKGKGKWQGTGVVLGDGTVVYVTYGEPPPQWKRFLDARVCVRGRMLNWSSLTKQSIVGPHLSELDFPVRIGEDNRPLPPGSLPAEVGRYVTLTGTARDAKGGAVLLTKNQEPVYIDDLASWPEKLHGKRVKVSGQLQYRQHLPEAGVDKNGAISQGARGKQYVLDGASWEAR